MRSNAGTLLALTLLTAAWSTPACSTARDVDDDDGGGGSSSSSSGPGSDDDGEGSTSSTGGPEDAVEAACNGIAERFRVCHDDTLDVAACQAKETCFYQVTRVEAQHLLLECYAAWEQAPNCGGEWCTESLQLLPNAAHTAHEERCASHVAQCGGDGGDICRNSTRHLESFVLDSIAECFTLPCSGLTDCVNQTLSTHACDSYPL